MVFWWRKIKWCAGSGAVWLIREFTVRSDRRGNIRRDINHQASTHWWIVRIRICWLAKVITFGCIFNLPRRCFSPLELSPEAPEMKTWAQKCLAAAPGYGCVNELAWDKLGLVSGLSVPAQWQPNCPLGNCRGWKQLPMLSWPRKRTDICPRVHPTADRQLLAGWPSPCVCVAVKQERTARTSEPHWFGRGAEMFSYMMSTNVVL